MMSYPDFKYKQVIFLFTENKEQLGFRADNIVVFDSAGKVRQQHSCHRIFALFIVGNISITSVVLEKSKRFGFPIILFSRNLRVNTVFNSLAEGNTLLRKKQYGSGMRSMEIAKRLVEQKINGQIALLKQLRYRAHDDDLAISVLTELRPLNAVSAPELLGMEGVAGKTFFRAYFRNMGWTRREPRTKRDVNNLLLDMGYTYLFNFIEAMLALYGFDVYCGVYHTFFYQRKSLVCDLMEPFRCIVDRRLRKAWSLRQIDNDDFHGGKGRFWLAYAKQAKYTKLFMKDILAYRRVIFIYMQSYYRWFVRDKPIEAFPIFSIADGGDSVNCNV